MKVTRRASWWGVVMPVVVKEAFRHDLDSRDQRKVLWWIAVTKEDDANLNRHALRLNKNIGILFQES